MLDRVQQAVSKNKDNLKKTLHEFCSQGDVEAIQSFLDHHPDFDINNTSRGRNTALHAALIQNQQGLVIDFLISRGANVDAFNSKGYNCVIFAITNCKGSHALEKLIRAGAIWKGKIGQGKFAGLSAQDVALQHPNSDATELLSRLMTESTNEDEEKKHQDGIAGISSKTNNRAMCPICKAFVKFPTKLSFIRNDQFRAEEYASQLQNGSLEVVSNKKDRYESRKYLDEFLSHDSGEAFNKLCGVEYHGINNKNKLRKEISESYSILHAVQDCCTDLGTLPKQESSNLHLENTFLIDLCAGKSLTTALCGVIFPQQICNGNKFLAVDRLPVHLVPHFLEDTTSYLSRDIFGNQFFNEMQQEVDCQTEQNKTAILVGMHLCGNLSERAIEFFERMPSIKALVLCPCCLPKTQRKNKGGSFNSYWKERGGSAHDAWCNFLKEKIEAINPDNTLFDISSYRDPEMHSARNYIIRVTRK
jgi:hypothetical protein